MNFRPFLHHVGIVQPNESEALQQISLLGLDEQYEDFRASMVSALYIH